MAIATALLFLLLASPAAFATDYTVGDSSGWAQGVDYTTWAKGKTFNVGDTLLFTYSSSLHKVDVVTQSDYTNCVSSNALSTHSDGNTTISLSQTGTMNFICPTSGHCASGMKLSVTVGSGSSSGGPTASPPPPSSTTPSGTTTPSSSGAAAVSGSVLGVLVLLGSGLVVMG